MTKPTVTQADREAADRWQHCEDNQAAMCQAFAAHREAAERTTIEKVVEWLRGRHSGQLVSQVAIADAIEVSQQELGLPDCHPEDAKECGNIIEAAQYLLSVYFMPEEL